MKIEGDAFAGRGLDDDPAEIRGHLAVYGKSSSKRGGISTPGPPGWRRPQYAQPAFLSHGEAWVGGGAPAPALADAIYQKSVAVECSPRMTDGTSVARARTDGVAAARSLWYHFRVTMGGLSMPRMPQVDTLKWHEWELQGRLPPLDMTWAEVSDATRARITGIAEERGAWEAMWVPWSASGELEGAGRRQFCNGNNYLAVQLLRAGAHATFAALFGMLSEEEGAAALAVELRLHDCGNLVELACAAAGATGDLAWDAVAEVARRAGFRPSGRTSWEDKCMASENVAAQVGGNIFEPRCGEAMSESGKRAWRRWTELEAMSRGKLGHERWLRARSLSSWKHRPTEPAFAAAARGGTEIVARLLERGVPPGYVNDMGKTWLEASMRWTDATGFMFLLEAGADAGVPALAYRRKATEDMEMFGEPARRRNGMTVASAARKKGGPWLAVLEALELRGSAGMANADGAAPRL